MRAVVFSGTTEGRAFSRALAALGAAVYFLLAGLMRLEEMGLARDLMKRILKRG